MRSWFAVSALAVRRLLPLVLFPVFVVGLALAQDKTKKGEEEETKPKVKKAIGEDEDPKAKPKKPIGEEEDPKAKPKKPLGEDEDPKSKPKKPPLEGEDPKKPRKPIGDDEVDLEKEAARAKHKDLAAIFRRLSFAHDELQHKRDGILNVEPLPMYLGDRSNASKISYKQFAAPNKLGTATYEAGAGDVVKVAHFEEIALNQAKAILLSDWEKQPPGTDLFVARLDQLVAADKILTFALKYLDTALAQKKRTGAEWDGVRKRLREALIDVLADELRATADAGLNDRTMAVRAADLAFHLGDTFTDSLKAQREVVLWKLNQANRKIEERDEEYLAAAKSFKRLQDQFTRAEPKEFDALRDRLRLRAQAHFVEGKRLAGTPDGKSAAIRQAEMAREIYADIPGLKEFMQELGRDFRMIVVGVRRLPELMSPALATTDAERWAVELLFESLVQSIPDPVVGQRFRSQLAAQPPRIVPLGREFELIHDAVWVGQNGVVEPVNAESVKETLRLLHKNKGLPAAEGVDLLQPLLVQDPFRFALRLDRSCIEPLLPMSFKIQPGQRLAKSAQELMDQDFARNPIGTGPFVYHGRRVEDGREYAVFKANPEFGKRAGLFGFPRIQEIRFVVPPTDPAADLRSGKIDLMLDVPTAEMVRLRGSEHGLAQTISEHKPANRRIWLLALNHGRNYLGGDLGQPLRRALAHAIDRESILKEVFRAGTLHHSALNGPFPNGTWAVPEKVAELYRPEHAQTFAKRAKIPEQLVLRFVDEPLTAASCRLIKQQIEKLGANIRIELIGQTPADFYKSVMLEHNYDLAYVPFDFANDTYWIGSFLDPEAKGRGERNFMEYIPDRSLAQLLQKMRTKRDFLDPINGLRRQMQNFYTLFSEPMPFVPLWQLDFHVLINGQLSTVPLPAQLDPATIFSQVEEWRVNR